MNFNARFTIADAPSPSVDLERPFIVLTFRAETDIQPERIQSVKDQGSTFAQGFSRILDSLDFQGELEIDCINTSWPLTGAIKPRGLCVEEIARFRYFMESSGFDLQSASLGDEVCDPAGETDDLTKPGAFAQRLKKHLVDRPLTGKGYRPPSDDDSPTR